MTFWDDERQVPKADGKGMDTIGFADLDSGVEIKSVYGASALSTFDKHVRSTKGKQCVSRLVIDVSENPNITDKRARELKTEALRNRRYPEAVMIGHGKQIVRVLPAKASSKKR